MKKVLITGANGLLGQALVKAFYKKYQIITTGQEEQPVLATGDWPYVQLDITNPGRSKKIINQFAPDVLVNAASYTHVDECERNREFCWQVNVKGVENLANLARRYDYHFIHYSTDYVFNGKKGPYTEEDRPVPLGYYGKSKLASENVLRQIGCSFTIVRTCVLYGTGRKVKKNFFLWVLESLMNEKNIRIVTDQYNNPTLAEDLALGSSVIIDQAALGLYNLAGKDYVNRFDFARAIALRFDLNPTLILPIKTTQLKQLAERPLKGGLNINLARGKLGYNPRSIEEALIYLNWKMKKHD